MEEQWKKISLENYGERYEISTHGRLRSIVRNKIITPDISDKRGYVSYHMYFNTSHIKKGAHYLVALAFIPNPLDKKTVNHKNGVKNDNKVDNLEWATNKEQIRHAIDTGLKLPTVKKVIQYSLDTIFIKEYNSIKEAAEYTNSSGTKISAVCKGKRKSHNNFIWKYKSDKDKLNNVKEPDLPSGIKLDNFSNYIITDETKIYSIFRHRFIEVRKPKSGYEYYALVNDNNKRTIFSINSIRRKFLYTKSLEKSEDGLS